MPCASTLAPAEVLESLLPAFRGSQAEHDFACQQLKRFLEPSDLRESLIVQMILESLHQYRRALLDDRAEELGNPEFLRHCKAALDGIHDGFKELDRYRKYQRDLKAEQRARELQDDSASDIHFFPPPAPAETAEEIAAAGANWRDRIALVPMFSPVDPILIELGVRVRFVLSKLEDPYFDEENRLLTYYPGLSRGDLEACKACEAEGLLGPFLPDKPIPSGIPVLELEEFKPTPRQLCGPEDGYGGPEWAIRNRRRMFGPVPPVSWPHPRCYVQKVF